ncbi:prolyl oligopeptidase family serine peptidase [Blastomonas sp.]|uniref:alpha/beta hydrolase family protein n=1 Tax=Blastomonas sp. TaxID=1909299 RepID=UPI002607DB8B|nr:prolyl oligopeptidase family serine peptidase [Blastomonas sp.]MDM7955796.1 prolyl oligopeptidase family serine peptidase [Blastomonas sp.]
MRKTWIAALCLVCAASGAAKPYEIDDMLAVQSYGKAVFDPRGEWAVVEKYRPYADAAAYHFDAFNKRMLGEIMRIDLGKGGRLTPLFPQSVDAGYWLGSASPDGSRLSVFRLTSDRLSLGIVDMKTSRVRWLPANPVPALLNPLPVWRDNRRLLVLAAPHDQLPFPLDAGSRSQREFPSYWQRSATGKETGTSVVTTDRITSDENRQQLKVVEFDVDSLDQRTIAEGHVADMALSPDARWLALMDELEDAKPMAGALLSSSALPRQHGIRILALDDDRSWRACTECQTMPGVMHWSDKGSSLLFFAGTPGTDWSHGHLHVFDADTGQAKPVQPPSVKPWLPDNDSGARIVRAGWHGREVLMLSQTTDGKPEWVRLGGDHGRKLASPCHPSVIFKNGRDLIVPCPNGVWRDRQRKTSRQATQAVTHIDQPAQETFDTGIRERYASIVTAAGRSEWGPNATGVTARLLAEAHRFEIPVPGDTSRLFGLAPVMQTGLAVSRSQHGASRLWLVRDGQHPFLVDAINTHLESVKLPRTLALPAASDGLVHWLFLPDGAQRDRNLPLVIMPYPGSVYPVGSTAPIAPDTVSSAVNPLLMTSLGYAVLLPSMPHDREAGEPASALTRQIEAAADAAIASGYVDASRMGVYGHSFGGYTALVVASQSRRFKATVAGAAPADLTLQHGNLLPYDRINLTAGFPLGPSFGWAELGQARLRAAPWQDPSRYIRNSPYYQMGSIQSPILLIHGDLDPVSVTGAERMFSGLYRSGKDATLLRYWGEGHAIRSPANIRDMWQFLALWLSARLGNEESRASKEDR